MRSCHALACLGFMLGAVWPGAAAAQDYPNRPVRLVVAYTPGGGADISARLIAQKAGEILGQQIVIENRPGAGGNLAADFVSKATPDGYTLLHTTVAHAISRSLYGKLNYDYLKDFVPIAELGAAGFVLTVSKTNPANTVAEFIAQAKSRTGDRKLTYASAGIGGPSHLAGEVFKTMAGVDMLHVPYKGATPMVTDVISGNVDATFITLPPALALIKSGEVKGLGLTSTKRSTLAPGIPTIAEAAVPGYEAITWYGAMAPTGTPTPILDRLNTAFGQAMKDPTVRAKMLEQGFDLRDMTRDEFGAFVRSESEKWTRIVEASGAKVE